MRRITAVVARRTVSTAHLPASLPARVAERIADSSSAEDRITIARSYLAWARQQVPPEPGADPSATRAALRRLTDPAIAALLPAVQQPSEVARSLLRGLSLPASVVPTLLQQLDRQLPSRVAWKRFAQLVRRSGQLPRLDAYLAMRAWSGADDRELCRQIGKHGCRDAQELAKWLCDRHRASPRELASLQENLQTLAPAFWEEAAKAELVPAYLDALAGGADAETYAAELARAQRLLRWEAAPHKYAERLFRIALAQGRLAMAARLLDGSPQLTFGDETALALCRNLQQTATDANIVERICNAYDGAAPWDGIHELTRALVITGAAATLRAFCRVKVAHADQLLAALQGALEADAFSIALGLLESRPGVEKLRYSQALSAFSRRVSTPDDARALLRTVLLHCEADKDLADCGPALQSIAERLGASGTWAAEALSILRDFMTERTN